MESYLKDNYIGTMIKDKEISLEDAYKYDKWVYFKCKQGHLFETWPKLAINIFKMELCPCCLKMKNESQDYSADSYENPKSLFQLDMEIFNWEISKRFIQTKDNYINQINYNSTKRILWNINGKAKTYSVKDMVKKLTEENQQRLKEIYEQPWKIGNKFKVIKCEACGKYEIKFYNMNIDNIKCDFCNEFVHNPFSFGRWLSQHKKVEEKLDMYLSWEQLNKLKGLHKDDENTNVVLAYGLNVKNTNVYCITHDLVDL